MVSDRLLKQGSSILGRVWVVVIGPDFFDSDSLRENSRWEFCPLAVVTLSRRLLKRAF
jgi:hypothetical protein